MIKLHNSNRSFFCYSIKYIHKSAKLLIYMMDNKFKMLANNVLLSKDLWGWVIIRLIILTKIVLSLCIHCNTVSLTI